MLSLACRSVSGTTHSPLYNRIFLDAPGTFRGNELGTDIQQVPKIEVADPKHEDKLGLTYEVDLGKERKMLLDYFSDNLKTERESNRLASIIANILLEDEVEAAKLYNEIQLVCNNRYRLASGVYGNYLWQSSNDFTSSIEVRLKLNEDKKGLTISFIDTEIRRNPEGQPTD